MGVAVIAVLALIARPDAIEPPELVVSETPEVPSASQTTPPIQATGIGVADGTWTALPEADTTPRTRSSMTWTGERVLIYGGQPDPGADTGLIYDPATETWSRMAASPWGSRTGHTTVWTGAEMIVFEGAPVGQAAAISAQSIDGAAYDPVSDTWRTIADAPVNPRTGHTALWTGEEMLIFGGSRTFAGLAPAAAYDPVGDTWRLTAASPLERDFGLVLGVWTGEEAIYWTGEGDADVASYDPASDIWTLLPPSPFGMRSATAVWTGEEMVVLGVPAAGEDRIGGMALDVDKQRWTVLPSSPQAFAATYATVWTGRSVVLVGGPAASPGAVWTPATGRWHVLPPALQPALSGTAAVWTGQATLVWGGQGPDGPIGTGMSFIDSPQVGLAD